MMMFFTQKKWDWVEFVSFQKTKATDIWNSTTNIANEHNME
jgi:hypothetical protein